METNPEKDYSIVGCGPKNRRHLDFWDVLFLAFNRPYVWAQENISLLRNLPQDLGGKRFLAINGT